MRRDVPVPALLAGLVGLALLALGVAYLGVECQALPGFMGPVHGDTSPRIGLGIVFVALGAMVGGAVLTPARRRRRA
jgi:hypothetical protein